MLTTIASGESLPGELPLNNVKETQRTTAIGKLLTVTHTAFGPPTSAS